MTNLLDRAPRPGRTRSLRSSGPGRASGDRDDANAGHRLPSAPRTRRPLLVAASAALVFLSIALFASIYSSSQHRLDALIVDQTIQQGQAITGSDLGQASVAISDGVRPIAVADASTLAGKRAAVTIPAGSLLVPGDVTSAPPLPPADAVVGLALKEGQLPSSGVAPGDQVMIVQTAIPGTPVSAGSPSISTGSAGTTGSGGAVAFGAATGVLVPDATVFDTSVPPPNSSSGTTELVSVEVSRTVAASVSAEATSGQISLVLLPSGSGSSGSGS